MSRTIEQMQDAGYEHVGENRDMSRRAFQEGGQHFYNTDAENAQHVIDEAAEVARTADYEANHKYKDDRRKAYGSIGDQMDMQYWDLVQGTDTFKNHVSAVKAAFPKPA